MTATTLARDTKQVGFVAVLARGSYKIAAQKVLAGTLAVISAGYAQMATSANGLIALGWFDETVDNSAGSAGDLSAPVNSGAAWFANSASTDAIAQTEVGKLCYLVDNQTVAKTSGTTGARTLAGRVLAIDTTKGVLVSIGLHNLGGSQFRRFTKTITHADLTAAAVSESIALLTPPANSFLVAHQITLGTAFSGGSVSAAVLDLGGTDADAIIDGADVFTGASALARSGTAGINPRGNFGSQALAALFVATGDNVVNLTAGSITIDLVFAEIGVTLCKLIARDCQRPFRPSISILEKVVKRQSQRGT